MRRVSILASAVIGKQASSGPLRSMTTASSQQSFYELSANDIDGRKVDFEAFRGKAVLVGNVASK